MTLPRTFLLTFAVTAMLARQAIADDWQYYQHDSAHTGDSSAFVNPQALSLAWSASSSPTGYSTPLIVGNTVYAMQNPAGTANPATISSFDLANGAIKWSYTGSFTFPSQEAVGGGFVVFHGGISGGGQLFVLDAITGALRYTVPMPGGIYAMPTIVTNPVTGTTVAYCTDGNTLRAVQLGNTSGTVLWTQTGALGSQSGIPTIVGNSVVLIGGDDYYAFDQTTGAANHFHNGTTCCGAGSTAVYDASRNELYVLSYYTGQESSHTLSAYHYTSNNDISLLWQRTGSFGDAVAIGPTGNVYCIGNGDSQLWELDPVTGNTMRFISGSFQGAPSLSDGVLWIRSGNQVQTYDLLTLQLLRSFNGHSTGSSIGAISDGHFLLDYGITFGGHGFDVYAGPVPEPTVMVLLAIGGIALISSQRKR